MTESAEKTPRIKNDSVRLSLPWGLLFLLGMIPLYLFASELFMLLVWCGVQLAFAFVFWVIIISKKNNDRIPIKFGRLEAALVLAGLFIAVRLGV